MSELKLNLGVPSVVASSVPFIHASLGQKGGSPPRDSLFANQCSCDLLRSPWGLGEAKAYILASGEAEASHYVLLE